MEQLDALVFLQAAQTLERNVSVALMYAGLRVPQFRLLDALAGMGRATVTEMSARLRITRATASVMINEMLEVGIVEMIENPADRRSFHIRLTELGRDKLSVARSDVGVLINELSRQYPQEMIRLLNGFARMVLKMKANG